MLPTPEKTRGNEEGLYLNQSRACPERSAANNIHRGSEREGEVRMKNRIASSKSLLLMILQVTPMYLVDATIILLFPKERGDKNSNKKSIPDMRDVVLYKLKIFRWSHT